MIQRPGTLLVADKTTLLSEIDKQFAAIHDISATVDMTPALGSAEKNKVIEYKNVRAYIIFRKPDDIRLIGLYPLVRGTAFDMVSDGSQFKLYIPAKDRFIVGQNEIQLPSPNKLENLRPQHFLDALLVRPAEHPEKVVLQNFTDENNAFYILHEVQEQTSGALLLRRAVWFNRTDLRMARQIILDDDGNVLTDALYDRWNVVENVPFPQHIEISRPRDEYCVVIDVVKLTVNKGVPDDRFMLSQPEGTRLQMLGEKPTAAQSGSSRPK